MADTETGCMLPRWQCHKQVYADRIVGIALLTELEAAQQRLEPGLSRYRWILQCGLTIVVTEALIARGRPQVHDYYVLYDDNYESWSPAKAFEEGYTKLDHFAG